MPELPEVETVCKGLIEQISNSTIIFSKKHRNNIRNKIPDNISEIILGTKIIKIRRIAKYISLDLNNKHSLIFHLGMSGKLLVKPINYNPILHDHFEIHLSNNKILIFNDPRRFGLIDLLLTKDIYENKLFKYLGKDPLGSDLNFEYLQKKLKNTKSSIKNRIMDSKIILGIGNIYASEILFKSKISPLRASNSLSTYELENLVEYTKEILISAINSGGSTLRDYAGAFGEVGKFQNNFKVYGRNEKPCYNCNSNIIKINQSSRSTFFCSNCQK